MSSDFGPNVILLAGPTASGKSAAALNLAQMLNGEIVNADSMQVYHELRILTARPTVADEAKVPHHLYGHVSVADAYSVARWAADVTPVIDAVRGRGNVPIVVGGTGLYFEALLKGLSEIPDIDPDIRSAVRDLARDDPGAAHEALAAADPQMAARLDPADGQRVARALEVMRSTGRSLADWQETVAPGPLAALDAAGGVIKAVLMPPREGIYRRCDDRLDQMIEAGALDEVAALPPVDPALPALRALGVPPLQSYLAGEISLDDAIVRAKTGTRQYAKRQMTWLRNRFGNWRTLGEKETERIIDFIFS